MVDETTPARSLGPEFWAIIGTGVAIAALILTVAGWQRADMDGLRSDMRDLSRKIESVQLGQSQIRERLRGVEVGQAAIRERLSGVEARIGAAVDPAAESTDMVATIDGEAKP